MNRYATLAARGLPDPRVKHGKCYSPTYSSWSAAIGRCHTKTDPSFPRYGGRGITVCDRWRDFRNFLHDMGERPGMQFSLDRIDNSRGYEPGNCRWALPTQQSRNRRSTKFVEINGDRISFMDACERAGLPAGTVRARLRKGYRIEDALSLPLFRGGKIAEWKAGA